VFLLLILMSFWIWRATWHNRRAVFVLPGTLNIGSVGDVANRYIHTMVLWPAGRWIDGIYWTLIIECSFYVVVAAGLWAWGPRSMPGIMMVVGGVSAACWAIRLAVMATGIDLQLDQHVGHFLLLVFGCHFATGGMLWVCLRDRATPARLVALAIFAGGVLAQLGYGQRGAAFIVDAIVLFAFVAAMLVSVRLDPVSRHAPVIRMIGLTSYPLYLLHNMLGKALLSALTGIPAPVALAGVLILVTAISAGLMADKEWRASGAIPRTTSATGRWHEVRRSAAHARDCCPEPAGHPGCVAAGRVVHRPIKTALGERGTVSRGASRTHASSRPRPCPLRSFRRPASSKNLIQLEARPGGRIPANDLGEGGRRTFDRCRLCQRSERRSGTSHLRETVI